MRKSKRVKFHKSSEAWGPTEGKLIKKFPKTESGE